MKFDTRRWDDEPQAPGLCNGGIIDAIFGGSGSNAPAPDPLIGEAAKANAEVAKEALDWYKQRDAESAPLRQRAADTALAAADAQTEQMRTQTAIGKKTQDYYEGTFQPLERQIVQSAQEYNTPQRQETNAANAVAGVGTAFEAQRANAARELAARGVDPSSGNFAATMGTMGATQAAAQAAAGNKARLDTETMGRAMMIDAAGLGRNLATNQTAQAQTAITAGNAAATNAGMPANQANQAAATYGTGFNTAIQGNTGAGNMLVGQFGGQVNAYKAAQEAESGLFGSLGNIAGSYLAKSDVSVKKDIAPVDGQAALEAVASTPVSEWTYKEGEGDGGRHAGPMAQDVKRNMGSKAAPKGKKIDLISMNGINMAAIQALNSKVDRLAAASGVSV